MEHNQKIMPAKVGDMIEWINPKYYITLQGRVLFVYENSVGVQILNYGPQHQEMFINDRTVVNHKRYKIIEKARKGEK